MERPGRNRVDRAAHAVTRWRKECSEIQTALSLSLSGNYHFKKELVHFSTYLWVMPFMNTYSLVISQQSLSPSRNTARPPPPHSLTSSPSFRALGGTSATLGWRGWGWMSSDINVTFQADLSAWDSSLMQTVSRCSPVRSMVGSLWPVSQGPHMGAISCLHAGSHCVISGYNSVFERGVRETMYRWAE